jgi:hypothetical protein
VPVPEAIVVGGVGNLQVARVSGIAIAEAWGIATAAHITSTVAAINALKPPEIGPLILYAFTIASADQMVGLRPSSLPD